MAAEECPVVEHTAVLSNHSAEITNLKESDVMQWAAIKDLQQRLPNWATLYISGLSAIAGGAVAALYFVVNYYRQ